MTCAEETEYMQGMPCGWTAEVPGGSDRKRWFATGNAVCVPVIEWMARRMRAVLPGEGNGGGV